MQSVARSDSPLVNWSQYLGLRTVAGVLQCFDAQQNLRTADTIGSLYYRFARSRRERAHANIRQAFPDWDDHRIAETAERSMQHMFRLFIVDTVLTPRLITPENWPRFVSFHGVERVLNELTRPQPVILVTGHCGNWELLGFVLSMLGFPVSALARPLDNPLINDWLLGMREARGLRIITKWGATPIVQHLLHENGHVGFIADQNAGDQGLFVPFFGRLASCYKSMGMMAMRYKALVVAGHSRRVGDQMKYEVACTDMFGPESWKDQDDPLFYITSRISRSIEEMIRASPEQYLWLHRRWKSRPKFEREGKPFPDRLVEKICALPWMTPGELDRIIAASTTVRSTEADAGQEDLAESGESPLEEVVP